MLPSMTKECHIKIGLRLDQLMLADKRRKIYIDLCRSSNLASIILDSSLNKMSRAEHNSQTSLDPEMY